MRFPSGLNLAERGIFRTLDAQLAMGHDPVNEFGRGNRVDVFHPMTVGRAEALEVAAHDELALIRSDPQAGFLEKDRRVENAACGALGQDQWAHGAMTLSGISAFHILHMNPLGWNAGRVPEVFCPTMSG